MTFFLSRGRENSWREGDFPVYFWYLRDVGLTPFQEAAQIRSQCISNGRMNVNTVYEPFFSPMVTELNIGPDHHKPKNIPHMFTLKWLVPETQLRRKSTLLPNFLYISNLLSRDLVPLNMDVREICVRRRRPLRRLFVGFVCCHIFYIEYLCYRNSRTPAAQCTMGRRKLVDSKGC